MNKHEIKTKSLVFSREISSIHWSNPRNVPVNLNLFTLSAFYSIILTVLFRHSKVFSDGTRREVNREREGCGLK